MQTRYFALIIGIVYVLAGGAGFIPALRDERTTPDLIVDSSYGDLFGLFPINLLHNIVHLVIGAVGVLSFASVLAARNFARGLAVIYGALAVMGVIDAGNLDTTFELIPLFSHDIWLHAGTAAIAAYVGWSATESRETAVRPGGRQAA